MKKEIGEFGWVDLDTIVYHFKKMLKVMQDSSLKHKYSHKLLNYIINM